MTLRIDVPLVADVLLVDEPDLMRRLNQDPQIVRALEPSGRWVNEMLRGHLKRHMRAGDTPLPTFANRSDLAARERQKATAVRLEALAATGLEAHAGDTHRLAAYVAGGAEVEIGVIAQRMVGRLFRPDYTATPESYRAAITVASATKWIPVVTALLRWSGRLPRAIVLVWKQAGNDTYCIHGTAIAMHNLVDTLRDMRAGFARGEAGRFPTAADAVRGYLRAPPALLRCSAGDVRVDGLAQPLRAGTIVIFQLAKVVRATGETDRAFARGEWNECPASGVAFRLLEQVWEAALRLRGGSGPRSATAS